MSKARPGTRIVRLGTKKGARPKQDVRLIQFRFRGVLHISITNVRDPHLLSLHDVVQLYARRWDIECAFLLLKTHLGLALFCPRIAQRAAKK